MGNSNDYGYSIKGLTIRAGSIAKSYGGQVRNVIGIIKNSAAVYEPKETSTFTYHINDFVLLVLDQSLTRDDHVKKAVLPSTDINIPSSECYASGWGSLAKTKNCTNEFPCEEGQGDCDYDSECNKDLQCGLDNCIEINGPDSGFDSTADCCFKQNKCDWTNSTWSCCTTQNPCKEGDGHCEND